MDGGNGLIPAPKARGRKRVTGDARRLGERAHGTAGHVGGQLAAASLSLKHEH